MSFLTSEVLPGRRFYAFGLKGGQGHDRDGPHLVGPEFGSRNHRDSFEVDAGPETGPPNAMPPFVGLLNGRIMVQVDHLLCLRSRSPSSAALQRALEVTCSLDATLHVAPPEGPSQPSLEDAVAELAPCASLDVRSAPPHDEGEPIEALQRYVREEGVDLVVVNTPSNHGSTPPLASQKIQSLIGRLDSAVFVVGQNTDHPSIQRILVPTDFSESVQTVFGYAVALAETYDASVDLLHVMDATPYVALTPVDRLSLGTTPFPERRARHQIDTFLKAFPPMDVSVTPYVEYGDPADQIVQFVNEHRVDVLVTAAHENLASPQSSLGPVADRVLRRVAGPLFLVRRSLNSASGNRQ